MTALRLGPGLGLSRRWRRRAPAAAPFSPNQLSDLAFWYDAIQSPVVESGGIVEQWQDLSGNGKHATQSNSAQRPTKTSDAAGRQMLRFDGADDVLLVSSPPDLSAGVTAFVVFRMRNREQFRGILAASAATGTDREAFFALQNSAELSQAFQLFGKSLQQDNLTIDSRPDSTEMQYAVVTIGTASGEFRDLNGQATDITTAVALGTPAAIVLGGRYNNGAPFSFGAVDIYEVGLYPRVLSGSELDQIEAYLKSRHGLTWSPMHIGKNLAWYHDSIDSDFTLTGSLVDQWNDRTAAARHWTQTADARPEKTLDVQGRAVVRFDGVDDVLQMAGTLPVLEPFSTCVVYRVRNRGDFEGVISAAPLSGADDTDFWTFQNASAASGDMQLSGRSLETDQLQLTRPDTGAAQIAIWTTGTGSAGLRDQNGSVADIYGGTFGTPDEIVLGGRYDGAPFGFAEVDVMATSASAAC
jgi:hypothetical protein